LRNNIKTKTAVQYAFAAANVFNINGNWEPIFRWGMDLQSGPPLVLIQPCLICSKNTIRKANTIEITIANQMSHSIVQQNYNQQ
jgi:hypothetical protein